MKYLILSLMLALSACSKSKADRGRSAQIVPAPMAGYTCFVIEDDSGHAVGGNCVKE